MILSELIVFSPFYQYFALMMSVFLFFIIVTLQSHSLALRVGLGLIAASCLLNFYMLFFGEMHLRSVVSAVKDLGIFVVGCRFIYKKYVHGFVDVGG